MKLKDFLDVADDDAMIEVYADDGMTRPCELKLVDSFQISDWVGGDLDIGDELEVYLDREVTSVAMVKLDGCGDDVVVAMRVYVEQKEGNKDVRDKGVRDVAEVSHEEGISQPLNEVDSGDGEGGAGSCGARLVKSGAQDKDDGHGQVKKVVGVLVHEHSVPELVIQEIPEGHGRPANLVVLPGIKAPDTDKLGGDDDIGFNLAYRLVRACLAAKEFNSYNRSAMCEHLGFAYAILCDLVTLVGASATDTVSEESVEALIRTAIDRVQWAGKAMGFNLGR